MAQLLWTQKQDIGPSARSDVAMAFDAARNRVVLFGGAGGSTAILFNDTWEWDGENWTQYEDIGPAPRSRHGMAYDSKRGRTVLFGGSAGNLNLNDTWGMGRRGLDPGRRHRPASSGRSCNDLR
jgi:hypothetical protein